MSVANQLSQLGLRYRSLGDLERSYEYQAQAYRLEPGNWALHLNYAVTLQDLGKDDDAIQEFRQVCKKVRAPIALTNYGMALLRRRPSFEGFQLFLNRWESPGWTQKKYDIPLPHILKEPKVINRILVMPDQGYGDTFFTFPFIHWLAQTYPGQVHLLVKPPVEHLAKKLFSNCHIEISQVARGNYDGWLTGLDIPGIFQASLEKYEYHRQALAKSFIKPSPTTHCGLVWRGNPDYQHENWRSVPYQKLLKQIGQLKNISELVIFHPDLSPEEIQSINQMQIPWVSTNADWLNSANYLMQVNELVGSDTGVIHLAGLLGVSTKLLLFKAYGWLWARESQSSFWYPSVKILQQNRLLSWDEPIEKIAT